MLDAQLVHYGTWGVVAVDTGGGMKSLRNFFFFFCQRSQKVAEPKHWTSVFCLATCAHSFLSYSNRFGFFFFFSHFPPAVRYRFPSKFVRLRRRWATPCAAIRRGCVFLNANSGIEIFTPLSARCCECVFDFNPSNCKMTRRERKEVCFGTRLVASVLLCGRCWCSELMRLKKKNIKHKRDVQNFFSYWEKQNRRQRSDDWSCLALLFVLVPF